MLLVSEPCLGEEEATALADTVASNWITMGERVRAFERAFADLHGVADGVAVSSCTAGLHLVLAALGVGPGDDVLVPSLTFVATANCVLYVGAHPIFVDIEDLSCPLISIEDAARTRTSHTKAVIVMHYGGRLVDETAWQGFARQHGLLLIEDAAHAAGAVGAGSVGDAAVFSFYGNKNMTTAEGGMVVARDPLVLERVRQMREHGMTSGTRQRLDARTPSYDVTMLGWNYRMHELEAALGLVQLRSLRRWNSSRQELSTLYWSLLSQQCPEVMIPFLNAPGPSANHLLPVLLPTGTERELVRDRMRQAGVQTTIHYPPIHELSFYRNRSDPTCLSCTEEFGRRELTLPLHPKMSAADVQMAVEALIRALRG
jgi:dTDP-4-amino-4,6-dideoxygalactose transaminase